MMNRSITPWHKPNDCYEACHKTENIMNQLKALVRSLEENEQAPHSHHLQQPERKPIISDEKNSCPVPGPQSHLPVPNFHPQCKCGKRNGLQDYCGDSKECCYMNPNANCGGPRMNQEQRRQQPPQFRMGDHNRSGRQEEYICSRHGEEAMINDFYMIPAEKCRKH